MIAAAPEEFWELHRLDGALKRLVADAGVPLRECADEGAALLDDIGPQYVANARGDYERWRPKAELIVSELSSDWAAEFGSYEEPDTLPALEELRAWLDRDVAMLRKFADESEKKS